jgi:putative oxidoreductase
MLCWLVSKEPQIRSLVRVVTGYMFMLHGMRIFEFIPPSPFAPPRSTGPGHNVFVSLEPVLHPLSGTLQVFGGAIFTLGLFTSVVSLILCAEMAVAWLIAHAPYTLCPLYSGENALLFCCVFLLYGMAGGGAWSLDRWFFRDPGPAVPPPDRDRHHL